VYQDAFGPFTPGFVSIPYGDAEAFEAAITPNTAAISVEPIQGEAGVIIPPAGYMKRLREICDRHNLLLLADEIQTGLGRTGKLFACEHDGIRPDVAVIGKALSGGVYPVSAVLASRELLGLFKPGEHGSTFGGNPLACAVGRAALKVIVEENLIQNSAVLGEYFLEQLAEIPSPHVKEARGKGLFIGVELKEEAGGARRFCEALKDRGILCKETHDHVIRFAPPLVIDKATIDWALPAIRDVLNMK
jgi:ornithine--oxo-acid transaminase